VGGSYERTHNRRTRLHAQASSIRDTQSLSSSRARRVGSGNGGLLIPDDPAKLFSGGKESRLPLYWAATLAKQMLSGGAEALQKGIASFYEGNRTSRAIAAYSKPSDYPPTGTRALSLRLTTTIRCPIVTTAQFHAAAGNPVWQYEFSHAFPDPTRRSALWRVTLRVRFIPAGAVPDTEKRIRTKWRLTGLTLPRPVIQTEMDCQLRPKYDVRARGS